MTKFILGIIAFLAMWLIQGLYSNVYAKQTQSTQGSLSQVTVERIALMPFLVGRMESPNTPIAKPLSKSFTELAIDSLDLPEGTDRVMNRIVNAALKQRFQQRLVPPDRTDEAYGTLLTNQNLDTPRKRAVQLGEALEANLVMVGNIWRYREKDASTDRLDGTASVGFALYLVDVKTGVRLWRGAFDGTQKVLSDDLLSGLKQLDMGLRWLSAEELARYGVKSVLKKLPLN